MKEIQKNNFDNNSCLMLNIDFVCIFNIFNTFTIEY